MARCGDDATPVLNKKAALRGRLFRLLINLSFVQLFGVSAGVTQVFDVCRRKVVMTVECGACAEIDIVVFLEIQHAVNSRDRGHTNRRGG